MNIRKMLPKFNANKRGVAPVVATILVILLTVLAAMLVAKFIIPLISGNLEESTECVEVSDYFYFEDEFGYNCYTGKYDGNQFVSRLYGVSVGARASDKELSENVIGFRLAFAKDDSSKAVSVIGGENIGTGDGEIRMFDNGAEKIKLPKNGEVLTYVYTTTN